MPRYVGALKDKKIYRLDNFTQCDYNLDEELKHGKHRSETTQDSPMERCSSV